MDNLINGDLVRVKDVNKNSENLIIGRLMWFDNSGYTISERHPKPINFPNEKISIHKQVEKITEQEALELINNT